MMDSIFSTFWLEICPISSTVVATSATRSEALVIDEACWRVVAELPADLT